MKKFKFNFKGNNFELNVEECSNIFSKARGLMFRKKSKPLLFVFKRPTGQQIHSFFCMPFLAIWFYDDKIVDVKYIKPWKISKPNGKFNRLLEIPADNKILISLGK